MSATTRVSQNGRTKPRGSSRAPLPGLLDRADGAVEPGEHPPEPGIVATLGEGVESPERSLSDASLVRAWQSNKRAGIGESVYPLDVARFPRRVRIFRGKLGEVSIACPLAALLFSFSTQSYECHEADNADMNMSR